MAACICLRHLAVLLFVDGHACAALWRRCGLVGILSMPGGSSSLDSPATVWQSLAEAELKTPLLHLAAWRWHRCARTWRSRLPWRLWIRSLRFPLWTLSTAGSQELSTSPDALVQRKCSHLVVLGSSWGMRSAMCPGAVGRNLLHMLRKVPLVSRCSVIRHSDTVLQPA